MKLKEIYKFLSTRHQNVFLEYKVQPKPRYGHGKPPHPELYSIINNNRDTYREFLTKIMSYKDSLWEITDAKNETDLYKPVWNNGFLPGLDIMALYTFIAEFKPKNYIEIGSGNSTKVVFKAKKELEIPTNIVSIDPHPRAEIDKLTDVIIRQPLENVDFKIFDSLEENDILFVDNSHRILPNSDSMVFYLEILPRLKPGVIVHIHDIYLPYDYPQFMCDRFYSEQYGLAINILANPEKYKPLLANYFIFEDKELSEMLLPIWDHANLVGVERHGGSFWLRIG